MKLCLVCCLSLSAGCFGESLSSDAFRTNSSQIGEAGSDPTKVDNVVRTRDNTIDRATSDDTTARDDGGTDPEAEAQSPMAADAAGRDALMAADAGAQDGALLAADGPPHADGATAPAIPAADAACNSATGSACGPCGATMMCNGSCSPPTCPIAIVQLATASCQGVTSWLTVKLSKAQKGGDLIVIAVSSRDGTAIVQSVTDTANNTYHLAIGPTRQGYDLSQSIYYASGIAETPPGNVITINFLETANDPEGRGAEYSGLSAVGPLDGVSAAHGVSATPDSGPVTTTTSRELLFAAGMTTDVFASAAPGFDSLAVVFGDVALARIVSVPGVFSAGGSFNNASAAWIMQLAAFH
jgi:hypothetical protein